MEAIPNSLWLISKKVTEERKTHKQISDELKQMYPGVSGLSSRSVRRFCKLHDIHSMSLLSDADLDRVVSSSIAKVGPTYGRKTMSGLLASQGIRASSRRVGKSLARVDPSHHAMRVTRTERQTNPVPYSAKYFGHKVHVDQNEKLVLFGVTHVCAIDGYSGMIVGLASFPVKNNPLIYEHLYRKMTVQYGLWDQIRTDKGKEWNLMLFVNEKLSHLRNDCSKPPHLQSSSKQNHMVERIWVEVNNRVNYPIKTVLIRMMENNDFSLDNDLDRYCVSWITIMTAAAGIELFVASWNEHPIPATKRHTQRGIPRVRMLGSNHARPIHQGALPTMADAVQQYECSGGRITEPYQVGKDPLSSDAHKLGIRHTAFTEKYPSFRETFSKLVNKDSTVFEESLKDYIDITRRISSTM